MRGIIKKNLTTLIIASIIILLPVIVGLFFWSSLPEQIPIHYNISGEVDGYGHKSVLFIIPLVLLCIQWAAAIEYNLQAKRRDTADINDHVIFIMSFVCAMCSLIVSLVLCASILGYMDLVQRFVPAIVGVAIALISNLTPKQKQNRWMGIRIKSTLNDKDNWMKTNRLGGKIGLIGGFLIMLLTLIQNLQVAYLLMTIIMLCIVIIPTIYSYVLNKQRQSSVNDR